VTGLTVHSGNLLNNTNNRLESFNGKLKSVIPIFSTSDDFLDKLFILLKCLRLERDMTAVKMVQKLPIIQSKDPDLSKYFLLLTSYSFMMVKKQFEAKSEILTFTTIQNCQCKFYIALTLPCCHIFNARRTNNISLYDEDLCPTRWTRQYYYKNQRVFKMPTTTTAQNNSFNEVEECNSLTVIKKITRKS